MNTSSYNDSELYGIWQKFIEDGVANLEVDGTSFAFLFKGDINQMIDRIHSKKINNLIVEEPALEEIFLHYYEKED